MSLRRFVIDSVREFVNSKRQHISMTKKVKLTKNDVKEKFIIKSPYGKVGVYPSGLGAAIVLSSVTIEFKKHDPNDSKDESKFYHGIYKNTKHKKHAEGKFLKYLKENILRNVIDNPPTDSNIVEIKVVLVQNYSPCNQLYHGKSGCADKIVKFKKDMEDKNISISLTIKFANFYKCYYKQKNHSWKKSASINGLVKLRQNGVELQLLKGEQGWKDFLNNKMFVRVSKKYKTRLLERATSKKRIKRETVDEIILNYVETRASGKQITTK